MKSFPATSTVNVRYIEFDFIDDYGNPRDVASIALRCFCIHYLLVECHFHFLNAYYILGKQGLESKIKPFSYGGIHHTFPIDSSEHRITLLCESKPDVMSIFLHCAIHAEASVEMEKNPFFIITLFHCQMAQVDSLLDHDTLI